MLLYSNNQLDFNSTIDELNRTVACKVVQGYGALLNEEGLITGSTNLENELGGGGVSRVSLFWYCMVYRKP